MIIEKPDGTIEFSMSGCCCPPGQNREGLHTNSCTNWFRINAEPWKRLDYRPQALRNLAREAESVAEFVLYMPDDY